MFSRLKRAKAFLVGFMSSVPRQLGDLNTSVLRLERMIALSTGSHYGDPRCLTRWGHQVYSQNDEDGIVDEVFRRIGHGGRTFVEIGASDGLECNTTNLLMQGWRGVWIEGDEAAVELGRRQAARQLQEKRLLIVHEHITAENIEHVLSQALVPKELDFLSIDIDGNDFWVWRAINTWKPRLVEIEYNASFGPSARWIFPYDPGYTWDCSTRRFGASLKALEDLGRVKGYSLVACCFSGVNAFFVRDDLLADLFLPPFTAERHFEPFRHVPGTAIGRKRSHEEFEAFQ